MRIVQLANFVGPHSGGIRTALAQWAAHYTAAGHEVVAIIPEFDDWTWDTPARVLAMPSRPLRNHYRVITRRAPVVTALEHVRPDVVEVSDRTTLRWIGPWARSAAIASVFVSHEHVTDVARACGAPSGMARHVADWLNRRTAARFDAVVAPSDYAAHEFRRFGAIATTVPLGVDLAQFRPSADALDARGAEAIRMVHCGRLSTEKNAALSVECLRALMARGVSARLAIAGDGPRRTSLERRAHGLPVEFLGHLADRAAMAELLARADVVIAPAPAETFCLTAAEAMASGTPVVSAETGALPEVVRSGGLAVAATREAFASAVLALVDDPLARARSRRRAEQLTWHDSGQAMLRIHERLARSVEARRGG